MRLQFDTRGFAAWLLAKPPGWEIRAGALPYLLKKERGPGEQIGRDKVRRFFRELEAAGYVTRRRTRKADGQWRWQIEFTDTPPTTPTPPRTVDGISRRWFNHRRNSRRRLERRCTTDSEKSET